MKDHGHIEANRYVVKSSGAGYKHTYRVYFEGDFEGSAAVTVTLDKATDAESIDSLFLMDSRNGNATFQGRIYNGQSGKPVTESESDAVGQFFIRSYLNITEVPETPENWLQFCDSLDIDMINDETVPDGIYILPENTSTYTYF